MPSAGAVSASMPTEASTSVSTGRRVAGRSNAGQNRPCALSRSIHLPTSGTLGRSMRLPSLASSAGRIVSELAMATSTTTIAASASDEKITSFATNRHAVHNATPSAETTTARPEVAAASRTASACRSDPPDLRRSSRSRLR